MAKRSGSESQHGGGGSHRIQDNRAGAGSPSGAGGPKKKAPKQK